MNFLLLRLIRVFSCYLLIALLFELDSDKNGFKCTNAFSPNRNSLMTHDHNKCNVLLSLHVVDRQASLCGFKNSIEKKYALEENVANMRPRGRTRYTSLYLNDSNDQEGDREATYYIRNARFKDLTAVANMLVQAFYKTTPLLKNYHELREVDRLQNNFPYNDVNHCMYVAISKADSKKIVGFVDIDFRTNSLQSNAPPRPYLSDLAVDENWRRKGIARDLIISCERKTMEMKKDILYLRVESENDNALKMYSSLGYHQQPSNIFGVYDTTMLLKRDLSRRRS